LAHQTAQPLAQLDRASDFYYECRQFIDADVWGKKFKDYPKDTNYAKNILETAGW